LHEVARVFSTPLGRSVTLMIAASEQETELSKAFRNHFILARRNEGRIFLNNAIAHGEIRKELDLDVALDLIYAPVFYRLLMGHAPLSARFMDEILSLALQGLASRGKP
jgi:Tetracyclin repressor-like, C-terminal domain